MPHATAHLIAVLTERGGVVRSRVLVENRISPGTVRSAVVSGEVIRPRKGWVALRDADGALVTAARHGVILTCRTQAKRLGLWVHEAAGASQDTTMRAVAQGLHLPR
ncbi:hypothetical protein [Microbacterium sp. H83]|uniref:hypothetical protein n=1 Tax=Microbacterium sp. H83 TaxID=1827324 RepID=UPI0007F41BC2|nr:hypothetical protein [Microbacterium sp. H83]OAN38383.1 hypothetical protein A4X16_03070 [Microbacterium sp. H83]